jgi:P22_AR N-terminal domain
MADGSDVSQYEIPLRDWGVTVPVAFADGRFYFPLRLLCAVLGIQEQMQIERLRRHEILARLLRQLPVKTRTGVRPTWCLDRRGIAFWLGSIQVASVRQEIRPRLLEFQEALVDAADRLLFGEVGVVAEIDTVSGVARYAKSLEQRIGRIEDRVFGEEDL